MPVLRLLSNAVALISLSCLSIQHAFSQTNPVADPGAIVRDGDARFTVLSDGLIRLEYDPQHRFYDEASFIVINRNTPVPLFQKTVKEGWLTIHTSKLELRYKAHSGAFVPDNLEITIEGGQTWHPGDQPLQNLKGTTRTLDTFDGDTSLQGRGKLQLEDGLLARDGWTLLQDTGRLGFDQSPWPWVREREPEAQDWYFFAYGKDYKRALYDYTLIAGKVPLPPRFAFGYWWSKYWKYSDDELRDLVRHFQDYKIPMDVMVIDMDWHRSDSWTGYTWDRSVFPEPAKFLQWLETQHLKTTLNLHPADGIKPFEERYAKFASNMRFDTADHKPVPFHASSRAFMSNLFTEVLDPISKQGVDFWWLDWQQFPMDRKIPALNNTWWLNYSFFSHMQKTSANRPMIYHRWGGLGNHRYQIGFSGDVIISWKSLAYQPYFTSTASNVLYGYWSHDIGGHMIVPGMERKLDPELYLRWLQYGVFSPILRTHSAKEAFLNKEPWNFGLEYSDAIRQTIRLRYQLAPYIYGMSRKTYDSAVSLCRPLYYDAPLDNESYSHPTEYMFGDEMLVSPVVAPSMNGRSRVDTWLPAGQNWYEWQTGALLKGGQTIQRDFALNEYPVYIKAGAVIPMNTDTLMHLQGVPKTMVLGIMPGGSGKGSLYEDEGNDQRYDAVYARILFDNIVKGNGQQLLIKPARGNYRGMPLQRNWELRFYGVEMPLEVKAGSKMRWHYDGAQLMLVVELADVPATRGATVDIKYANADPHAQIDGLLGQMHRFNAAVAGLKQRASRAVYPAAILSAAQIGRNIDYHPEQFNALIAQFKAIYRQAPELLKDVKMDASVKEWFAEQLR